MLRGFVVEQRLSMPLISLDTYLGSYLCKALRVLESILLGVSRSLAVFVEHVMFAVHYSVPKYFPSDPIHDLNFN